MTDLLAIVIGSLALVAARIAWELGRRRGHKHEREWNRARYRQLLTTVERLDPDALDAIEVAAYMLTEQDQELVELERIGRL